MSSVRAGVKDEVKISYVANDPDTFALVFGILKLGNQIGELARTVDVVDINCKG